jgi:lincosamide and streptogramin A transport system ATP-binding/permease protein
VSFIIRRGDRIALDGINGCGKSSLLRIICGEHVGHEGTVCVGSNLKISYVNQDTSRLSGSLDDFIRARDIDGTLFKAILNQMDFERGQFEKNMEEFSGGQKKKVLIASSLCDRANLYVWDEPLNFIDVYSRVQIERLILTYMPTMIFVEHDKAFRDRTATEAGGGLNGQQKTLPACAAERFLFMKIEKKNRGRN